MTVDTRDAVAVRVAAADWTAVATALDEVGAALLPPLLSPEECGGIAALYERPELFRSTVDMARYRFGSGQYRYFDRPFPELVQAFREELYERLLPIAREWWTRLGRSPEWPDSLAEWLEVCHAAGQVRPTPILLRYRAGDWNALHRDLYGDKVFPLQVVVNLSAPGDDHTGGEFVVVEQRPRAQSRATTTLIPQGQGLAFTTRDRPVRSARGWSAAPMRHGVSTVRSGERFALGFVFHDAT
jgi:hypothetical protein